MYEYIMEHAWTMATVYVILTLVARSSSSKAPPKTAATMKATPSHTRKYIIRPTPLCLAS